MIFSLLTFFWDPYGTFRRVQGWAAPYAATVTALAGVGFLTQSRLIPWFLQQFAPISIGTDGADMLRTGAYLGVLGSAVLLPLIIPWCLAFVSKFVSLFIGVRTTFAEYFKIYEWGFYGATLPVVLGKLVLMWFLPIEQWNRITLSLAALVPKNFGILYKLSLVLDLSTLLLIFFAWVGLRSTVGKDHSMVALCTMLVLMTVQMAVVL